MPLTKKGKPRFVIRRRPKSKTRKAKITRPRRKLRLRVKTYEKKFIFQTEGKLKLDFPDATYDYTCGGYLDYFIEKALNDMDYVYRQLALETPVLQAEEIQDTTETHLSLPSKTFSSKPQPMRCGFMNGSWSCKPEVMSRVPGLAALSMKGLALENKSDMLRKINDYLTPLGKRTSKTRTSESSAAASSSEAVVSDVTESDKVYRYILRDIILDGDVTALIAYAIQSLYNHTTTIRTADELKVFIAGIWAEINIISTGEWVKKSFEELTRFDTTIDEYIILAIVSKALFFECIAGVFALKQKIYSDSEMRGALRKNNLENLLEEGKGLIDKAIEVLREEYQPEEPRGVTTPRALRLRAPKPELQDLYEFLCFHLEPHHDFHGARVFKQKDKGKIIENKPYYRQVKDAVTKFEEKPENDFNIDNFTSRYPYEDIGKSFTSRDEFTNLLKIMREINASENSVTISFKEVVDAKFGKPDLDKVWAEGITGEDLTLSKLIEEVSGLILDRSLFKDAGGSVFLGRIDDLRGVKEKPTGFDELIANIQNSTDFAERLFDGAGQSVIKESVPPNSRHVIKVEYEKEVFKTPKKLPEKINDIEIRIEGDSLEPIPNNKIRILPSIYNRDVSIAGKQVTYTIKLPVRIDKTFKYFDFQFEPVVYDLSLLIRYYLVLKKETNKPSDLTDDICDSVIWTLLNLKRMGDHGQAERAKIGEGNLTGIFESGDQLAAAYGMMIETPTIATYSRRGYGNHFIFYGANLDLGQLKTMIEDYIKVLDESEVKTTLSEKLGRLVSDDEDTKKEAQKLLTLTSAIGKLQTASQNEDFNKIFNRIVSKFNEMATKFAGGERQGKWGALKVLPLSSLVTIMVGKKKAIKSLLETAFNTIILLTNILKQLIDMSKHFNIEGYVKRFIIDTFEGVFSESKVGDIYTHFQGLLTLITETKTLGAGETITYTSLLKVADDIQTYIEWELNDILQPITDFFKRLNDVKDWKWNFTNVENKLKSITGDQPSSPA